MVCGKTERECENLKVGSQIRNGETRLILKLSDSVEKIGNYLDVGFVVTIDGIEVTVKLDRVYSGFYNGGTMISAEDLGATYVAIAEIGNISAAQTVTAQGFYTDPDGTVNYGIKRSLK